MKFFNDFSRAPPCAYAREVFHSDPVWTDRGEMRHPVFLGYAKETDVIRNLMKSAKASQISARRVEQRDVQFFQSACMESYARPA